MGKKAPRLSNAFLLLFIASLLLHSGCGEKRATQGPRCVIFVLFDISGSTSTKEIRQRYYDDFLKILDQLRGGEVLLGDVITENTMATISYPINQTFPAYNPLTMNPLTFRDKMKKAREAVIQQAKKLLFERPPAPRTDMLNAFQAAEKVFNGEKYQNASYKILVVFSDMIEQTKRYDFIKEKLTEKRIKEIIDKERREGRLADLKGVKVWVAGATAALRGGLPPSKIQEIQNFWLTYFSACGANLTKERYAPTLINFEIPSE